MTATAIGPQSPNYTVTRPALDPVVSGGADTWFANCSAPGAKDGTIVDADWLNTITDQLRTAIRTAGVTLDGTNSSMLWQAMQAAGVPYANSLSPKGASSASAFTAGLVVSDIKYGTDGTTTTVNSTLSQTLAFPAGTTWVQASGVNSIKNTNSTYVVNFTTWLVLTGSDSSIRIGAYVGAANVADGQTPLVVSSIWTGLNPAVTYTLKLWSQKGVNQGPVNIYDARINALYGA